MFPRLVLNVASQTEVAGMHGGGALVKQHDSFRGTGGRWAGRRNRDRRQRLGRGRRERRGGVVLVELEARRRGGRRWPTSIADPFTRNTIRTMIAARITAPMPRRRFRRRFLSFSMTACFCSRAARCRALLSLGTERQAIQPSGHGRARAGRAGGAAGRAGRAGPAGRRRRSGRGRRRRSGRGRRRNVCILL